MTNLVAVYFLDEFCSCCTGKVECEVWVRSGNRMSTILFLHPEGTWKDKACYVYVLHSE